MIEFMVNSHNAYKLGLVKQVEIHSMEQLEELMMLWWMEHHYQVPIEDRFMDNLEIHMPTRQENLPRLEFSMMTQKYRKY